jgi:hypothetical protein
MMIVDVDSALEVFALSGRWQFCRRFGGTRCLYSSGSEWVGWLLIIYTYIKVRVCFGQRTNWEGWSYPGMSPNLISVGLLDQNLCTHIRWIITLLKSILKTESANISETSITCPSRPALESPSLIANGYRRIFPRRLIGQAINLTI